MAPTQGEEWETTEIVICGGGPVGELLSAYLGRLSVHNVVLEREINVPRDPRAFSLGEEGIRLLQCLGLYDQVYSKIGRSFAYGRFVGGRNRDLNRKPFLRLNFGSTGGATGLTRNILFNQPIMENCLRSVIDQSSSSELRVGSTVTSIDEDENFVYVRYRSSNGDQGRIRSRFLVGTDGKTGYTRKMYLEPKGVLMERTNSYEETYISLNWDITVPTPTTHPEFPLWKIGYTPEEVYDAFIPSDFIVICNPERQGCSSRVGVDREDPKIWRFEFSVLEGEDPQEMGKPDIARTIVLPYLTHAGSRYGLKHDVRFPEDCMKLRYCSPYKFAARTCNKWSLGRVMLAGDAAHVFPPFGGQGICAGFKDAEALAWRLAVALRPSTSDFHHLFEAWSSERKQDITQALAFTIKIGDLLTERHPLKIFVRDWFLWALQLVPSWKKAIETPEIGGVRYKYAPGMVFLPDYGGGVSLPQIFCVPIGKGKHDQREVLFTDDVIFRRDKRSLFQLVVLLDNLTELADAEDALRDVDSLSNGELLAAEATHIVHDSESLASAELSEPPDGDTSVVRVVRIATAEEFMASDLSKGRPEAEGYEKLRMRQQMPRKKFIVVRPDRIVFAACADKAELDFAAQSIERVLSGGDA